IGSMIPGDSFQTNNSIIEKYCYDNNPDNCIVYGGLYQWPEMMQYITTPSSKGICANGWHLPSNEEWDNLACYLGGLSIAGGKMKQVGNTYWSSPNISATNESGFTGLGAGWCWPISGYFSGWHYDGIFWSSSEFFSSNGYNVYLISNSSEFPFSNYHKEIGYSVRCLKDICSQSPTQSNAGPDQTVTGTSTTLAANTPQYGTGSWGIVSGNGGVVAETGNPLSGFTGLADSIYLLTWTISTACASSVDTVVITFNNLIMNIPCPGLPSFVYEGRTYNTVQIGNQCWMRENLNVGTMVPSTNTGSFHSDCNNNGIIEKYCYNNDPVYCNIYGGLYDWNEMMLYSSIPGKKGICPTGWHIPTDEDVCILTTYLDPTVVCNNDGSESGITIGAKLKETGTNHWAQTNSGVTNESGFTALGAGYRDQQGYMSCLSVNEMFWTSSTIEWYSEYLPVRWYLFYQHNGIDRGLELGPTGYSVRCLKDTCSQSPTQSDAGPNQTVTGTSTNLAANVPQYGTGSWSIVTGNGGVVAEPGNPLSGFTGLTDSTYLLTWTISNACASSVDSLSITFSAPVFTCGSAFTDTRDGYVYNTVQIGEQCWMKQNLNVGLMIAGSAYQTNNGTIERYCYDNNPLNCDTYGALYQWDEMMNYAPSGVRIQGICPFDWHIPSVDEWTTLSTTLGGDAIAGGKMKETGLLHWDSPNSGANNESGFSGLGAGCLYGTSYNSLKNYGIFWTSYSHPVNGQPYFCFLGYYDPNFIIALNGGAHYGYSVRCIKNCVFPLPSQSYAGSDQTLSVTTTTLAGNTPLSGTGTWSLISGSGGTIAEVGNPVSVFTGIAGNTYTLIWTINTACASSIDTVVLIFNNTIMNIPCPDLPSFVYGGQTYNTVQIGNQCWMRENLNIGIMISGSSNQTNNNTLEKYCYNNDPANCSVYGGFYQWDEIMQYNFISGTQGICPSGWHIPTDNEWCAMTSLLDTSVDCINFGWSGLDIGDKLKETSSNQSGFTAVGAGYRAGNGGFNDVSNSARFWTSTEYSSLNAVMRYLYHLNPSIGMFNTSKLNGYSVRCIKNP
ncbi:MAG: hypothetical protein NTU44_20150, partial [Bacteroidetes bacterium]|nr:hypothetical protein [Bacteroidota bacterium]